MLATSSDDREPYHEANGLKAFHFPGLCSLVASAAGGICSVLVGYPFYLVKVRLQTADRTARRIASDVVRSILSRDGGIRLCQCSKLFADTFEWRQSIYAGVTAPLMGVTPICTVPFRSTYQP